MYLYYCIYNQPTTFAIHKDTDGQKTSSSKYIIIRPMRTEKKNN